MDLKESDILGVEIGDHWYYRSKARAMEHLLYRMKPSIILDVGAGSGFFSRMLLSNTSAKQAWCVDISYEADTETLEAGKPVYFRRSVDEVDADLVLLMDVLEHVDDDVGLLNDYVKKVPCGARFLISVPAFQFLWSGHDVFLEHKRRYRLKQLEDVVRRAGLKVKHGSYYFGAVFPIAAAIRLVTKLARSNQIKPKSQLSRHHVVVNETLAAMSAVELPFVKTNRLAGLTAFCVAEKA
jgi:SAM-dependent methyltransferase